MALSIKPEVLFNAGNFEVTNSFISYIFIILFTSFIYILISKKISIYPKSKLGLGVEIIIESLKKTCEDVVGTKITKEIFTFIFSFFVLILFSNLFGLMPFTGSIGIAHPKDESKSVSLGSVYVIELQETSHNEEKNKFEIIPFFRSPSADLNFTVSMGIITFLLIQITALKHAKIEYLKKFFDLRVPIYKGIKIIFTPIMFVINLFWRLLETVLELSKLISFSFRLFGSIFAGEVLLFVITSLTLGIGTLLIFPIEIFVSFIQAFVFIFLTLVFIKVGIDTHH
ncbi:MAG: F0F1 ATP synthase subunit A [Candidatus Dojkabacteria bacterium]|nr:F0F1 ATP synthase subunit A [Candidatus Dojkabacteria bacterium]